MITGITGQDGSYLAELLLEKGYRVFGLIRRTSTEGLGRIQHLVDRVELVQGDLTDSASLQRALLTVKPQEIYNLGAQSHVGASFTMPVATGDATALGALRLFEATRLYLPLSHPCRLYQASSSEMFGNAAMAPQDEQTPLAPVSPYGCAKVFAHHAAQIYRSAYRLPISCGISFNHESERRGKEFVTRKITLAVGEIAAGTRQILRLGNLHARRDWLHAEDVVRAAWLLLQQPEAGDYVIASGETHSVQEFVDAAFNIAGINSSEYVKVDPDLFRPLELHTLVGNATKLQRVTGWRQQIHFQKLVARMVLHDLPRSPALADHPSPAT